MMTSEDPKVSLGLDLTATEFSTRTRVPDWFWLFLVCPAAAVAVALIYLKVVAPNGLGPAGIVLVLYAALFSFAIGLAAAIGGVVFALVTPRRLVNGWVRLVTSAIGVGVASAASYYYFLAAGATEEFHSPLLLSEIGILGLVVGLFVNGAARLVRTLRVRRAAYHQDDGR
jgi:hypothetical protein